MVDATPQFAAMYNGLVESLGLTQQNFQLLLPFTPWNWTVQASGSTDSAQYGFLDQLPNYNAVGSFQSGTSLYQAYQTWLNIITVQADPVLQNQLTIDQGNLTVASNQYTIDQKAAMAAYHGDATVVNNVPDFVTWLNQPFGVGAGYVNTLTTDIGKKNALQAIVNQDIAQANDPTRQAATAALANTAYYTNVVGAALPNPIPSPGYNAIDAFTTWVTQNAGTSPTQVMWENATTSNSFKSSWAQGSATVDDWFFSAYVKGSWQRLNSLEQDASTQVTLTFNPWGRVSVTPSQNFDESYFLSKVNDATSYRKGYGPAQSTPGATGWTLGQNGILPARITDFLVAYQPGFAVETSAGLSQEDYQAIEVATGFRIGPFTFGGDGGNTTSYQQTQVSNKGMSGKSTSQFPMIFGVLVRNYSAA